MSQNNNRFSVQTGLFHCFFDQTPIVKTTPDLGERTISNLFGGFFIDSRGFQYQRLITPKSAVLAEFMSLCANYGTGMEVIPETTPMLATRNIKTLNISYLRRLRLTEKWVYTYGGGLNYRWGHESIYLDHEWTGLGWRPRYSEYNRYDAGLNVRTGIEYSPLKWLTLYSHLDFIGIVYLGAKDSMGYDAYDQYNKDYGRKNIPSRYDLSLRFGIGVDLWK